MNKPDQLDTLPAIIVISSHVVRGTVGNRAAVFALETLGFPVWALQTVTLPWHPGHGRATRLLPDEAEFASLIDDLCNASWLSEVGGILTGYLGSPHQATSIARLIKALKAKNPNAVYLCDPVIGDAGGLYVAPETAIAIRDQLMPLADIATPNKFELQWLSGQNSDTNQALIEAAEIIEPKTIIATSAHAMISGNMANLLVSNANCVLAEHRYVEGPSNGLGDLTSALFLGHTLFGETGKSALQKTTASVFEVMASAAKRGANELMLAKDASSLHHPMAMVTMRSILSPKPKRLLI